MRFIRYLAVALMLASGATMAQSVIERPTNASSRVIAQASTAPPAPATPAPAQRPLTAQDANAWLDGLMPYVLARGDVAGAVVVIVKDRQILTQRGFGYADMAARKPVDPARTLFRSGSVSKLYTWTAVMQQVEAGKLDLDADINRYLDFNIPPFHGKPITLRNLMTHTSGFEEAGRGQILQSDTILPLDVSLKRWTPHRVYAPGSTPAYSNYGAALAGYIVQRVSGMPYVDYIERNIFQRLGMTYATFREPLPAALKPYMSRGYDLASAPAKPFETVSMLPPGASSISGGDMAKFMIAHLDRGGALLKPATAALMHAPANTPLPGLNRMMLGFYEQQINGRSAIAHGGDLQWFHSNLVLFPGEKVGIYMSVNSLGKDKAAGAIRSALLRQFADRYFPAPSAPTAARELPTARAHAALLAGTYATSRAPVENWGALLAFATQVRIGTDKDGRLSAPGWPGISGAPRTWIEIAPFIWQSPNDGDRIGAKVVDGKVVRLFYDPVAPFMVWDPVRWYNNSTLLLPLAGIALAIVLLTAIAWPLGAINRRRYGATLALAGRERRIYRAVRICACLILALVGSWAFVIIKIRGLETPAGLIWANQLAGVVLFVGLPVIAAGNVFFAWKGRRGWFSKTWSVLLLLSGAILLWMALVTQLLSFGADW